LGRRRSASSARCGGERFCSEAAMIFASVYPSSAAAMESNSPHDCTRCQPSLNPTAGSVRSGYLPASWQSAEPGRVRVDGAGKPASAAAGSDPVCNCSTLQLRHTFSHLLSLLPTGHGMDVQQPLFLTSCCLMQPKPCCCFNDNMCILTAHHQYLTPVFTHHPCSSKRPG
jgi:hypothetical protein